MPNKYLYRSFGFTLNSEIECPELLPGKGKSDVEISFGIIPEKYCENKNLDCFWKATPSHFFFSLKDIARFLVVDGNQITIEAAHDAEIDKVRLFLLGTCFGALMHQRGLFLIHGSGVAINKECVIFSGQIGVGKSTMAAAFRKDGYPIMADDICAISMSNQKHPLVHPGYPQLKLRSDSLRKVSISTTQLKNVSSNVDKFRLPITGEFHTDPLPLKAVYILDKHDRDTFSLNPLHGIDKFKQLANNTYRASIIGDLGLQNTYFKQCAKICAAVNCYHFQRPHHSFLLKEAVAFIKSSLNSPHGTNHIATPATTSSA